MKNTISPARHAKIVLEFIRDDASLPENRRAASSVAYYSRLAAEALERLQTSQQVDPSQWPSWTDRDVWSTVDDRWTVQADDLASDVETYVPTQADWECYRIWSEGLERQPHVFEWVDYATDVPPVAGGSGPVWLDHLEEMAGGVEVADDYLTDADIQAAGGAVG